MNELTSVLTGDPCCEKPYPVEKEYIGLSERSVLQQLEYKRNSIAKELAKVDAAIECLSKNPEIADALTKVGKALQVRY
jgi:hypothetical protein